MTLTTIVLVVSLRQIDSRAGIAAPDVIRVKVANIDFSRGSPDCSRVSI